MKYTSHLVSLRKALENKDQRAADDAMERLLADITPEDALDLLAMYLSTAVPLLVQLEPKMKWIEPIASRVSRMTEEELDQLVSSRRFDAFHSFDYTHFYSAIASFQEHVESAIHLYKRRFVGPVSTESILEILFGIGASLISLAWAYANPEEYVHWWVHANWTRTREGPDPATAIPPRLNDSHYANYFRLLRAVIEWLETLTA